jgi:uridine kinase
MKFIFIAGASASGKSTLSAHLSLELFKWGISNMILKLDDYSIEAPDHITDIHHYRQVTNFDRLEMYDLELVKQHLLQLAKQQPIEKPCFDFATNKRVGFELVPPQDVLIVEGLFALVLAKSLPQNLDQLSVFISPSTYLSLLAMRTARDEKERNYNAEQTKLKERLFVGPCFFEVIAKSKTGVDIDITNDPDESNSAIAKGVEQIVQTLNINPR